MAPPRIWFAKEALLCRSQGRKSNAASIAAFDQPPAVCFGPRPCPADTGRARPNVQGCVLGHRRLRKVGSQFGRGGGRPQRSVSKDQCQKTSVKRPVSKTSGKPVGSNLAPPRQ